MVGVTMGINNLLEVFNEKYYENLDGGILESFGRLLKNSVKLYIYPMRMGAYNRYCLADPTSCPTPGSGISEHPLAMERLDQCNKPPSQTALTQSLRPSSRESLCSPRCRI
jgi:hypothetical protein